MEDLSIGGVAVLSHEMTNAWSRDVDAILEVLLANHSNQADYKLIGPVRSLQSMTAMRTQLLAASPFLGDLTDALRRQLAEAVAVYIPSLGLEKYDVNTRSLVAYAIAACMGNPTATDHKRVIWDVKVANRGSTYFSTFSETDLEAGFHTDTQYYPDPEPIFLLYCITPARCYGGLSSICDGRALRRDIEKNDPWIFDILSHALLPFRVPSAFVTTGNADTIEATLAPVFAQTPLIRYRRDTLAEGLEHFPEYGNADVRRALGAFEDRLQDCPHQVEFFMPADSMVVVDNHRALHARTAFQDTERHLLRIRLDANALPQQGLQQRLVRRERELSPY